MSYDLRCRNSELENWSWGAFSWPLILEIGLGLPLGYAKGIRPAQFIYDPDKKGRCVAYNDGAHVTAKQSRQMAQIARWIVHTQRTLRQMWDGFTQEERDQLEKSEYTNKPYGKDFTDRLERFADWLEKSGGFNVH